MSQFNNNGYNYSHAFSITTNDTTTKNANAFMVTVAGTVSIKTPSMASNLALTVLAGVIYPIGGQAVVFHTDSTATGIIGLR